MIPYQAKAQKIPGTNYAEVRKQANNLFVKIKLRTKRKVYVRSPYFNRQKIFFDFFWRHLQQKNPRERFKRLKYFAAAIELIKNSREHPCSKQNPNNQKEILHRFAGLTREKELFYVQIKENKKNGKKYFMSCFSPE